MMDRGTEVLDLANGLKAHSEAFAIATVVRTVAATAASPVTHSGRTLLLVQLAPGLSAMPLVTSVLIQIQPRSPFERRIAPPHGGGVPLPSANE